MQFFSKKLVSIILCAWLGMVIVACSQSTTDKEAKSTSDTIVIKPLSTVTNLYFTGTIEPIRMTNVVSPVTGIVAAKYFAYGQQIKKGQKLVIISSTMLETDFQDAITAYLKAKHAQESAKKKLSANKQLLKLGFIPQNEYDQSETTFEDSNIELLRANTKLFDLIKKRQLGIATEIEKLTIHAIKAVTATLQRKFNQQTITAPSSGIALFPQQASGAADDAGGETQISVGSEIKNAGQVIVSIGDFSGIALRIKINEIDINRIKPGLKVAISGDAFPGITLQGYIASVDVQAKASQSGGLPEFVAMIKVAKLTKKQQQIIKVGMSAKAQVSLVHKAIISIPITAVIIKGNRSYVRVKNSKTGNIVEVPVTTGQTSQSKVEITQGLQAGDVVVIGN